MIDIAGSAAAELARERFKGTTVLREHTENVLTGKRAVVQNNPRRVMLTIQNIFATDVYISFNPNATLTSAIILPAYGGTITILYDEDGEIVTYELFAFTAGGDGYLHIWEVERL
jgi:hypothetical protein